MVTRYNPKDAPGFAKHSSTYKNDDRCYETDFFVGDNYDDVLDETLKYFTRHHIDYDVNYSTEGGAYVGVLAKDHDEL